MAHAIYLEKVQCTYLEKEILSAVYIFVYNIETHIKIKKETGQMNA